MATIMRELIAEHAAPDQDKAEIWKWLQNINAIPPGTWREAVEIGVHAEDNLRTPAENCRAWNEELMAVAYSPHMWDAEYQSMPPESETPPG